MEDKNKKLAEKIMTYYKKEKYEKMDKIMLKNKDNFELFDILLTYVEFTNHYLISLINDSFFKKLSIEIQKKLIYCKPHLIWMASDELKNDKDYMLDLYHKLVSNEIKNKYKVSIYQFLGPKLLNDKDFMLKIRDEDPLAFLNSMKNNNYDDNTIISFFNDYPQYVSNIPEKYKRDYDFIIGLINRIPKKYVPDFCSGMDVEYLKTNKIKQAIINYAGESNYIKTIIMSLYNDETQLNKINAEELKQLILVSPVSFLDINKFNLLGILKKQKENVNLINIIKKISKLHFKDVDIPNKLTKVLYKLSQLKGNGLTYEAIYEQINKHWSQILPWIIQVDQAHVYDDKFSNNESPKGFYIIYNILIGIESGKLEDMFKIFVNFESRSSEHAIGIKNIDVSNKNLLFLQLICDCNIFDSNEKLIDIYNKLFLRISEWNQDPYKTIDFIENLSKDNDLVNLLFNEDIDSIDQNILKNIYQYVITHINSSYKISSLDELRDFQKIINASIEQMQSKNINKNKNKMFLKHFQIDLNIAKEMLHSYFDSNLELTSFNSKLQVNYIKQIFENIINCGSLIELEELEKMLDQRNVYISFEEINKIIGNIKTEYGNKLNKVLFKVTEKKEIIDISNYDFNLLVHVIGAYGSTPPGDVYESWNTKEMTSTTSICTSFITDDNMGIVPTSNQSIILGFNNFPEKYLELMAPYDLWSKGFSAGRTSKFLTPKELIDNTRHGYNEVVINRRNGKYMENKVEPSYIICFDKISEESKIAAEKFDVPLLFIDREKVAIRQHKKIMNLVDEFCKTLNPNLISQIIYEQENNRSGLRLVRTDLQQLYFGKEFRQRNIDIIFEVIKNNLNNNSNALNCANEFIKVIEKEACKYVADKETMQRKNAFDIDYEKYINIFKNKLENISNYLKSKNIYEREQDNNYENETSEKVL